MKELSVEGKELLLEDLCARLRYGVKCCSVITNGESNTIGGYCEILDDFYIREVGGWFNVSMIKPYLRPMSSMTEEEKEELKSKCIHTETEEDWEGIRCDVWGIQILDKYDTRRWDNPIWPSTINMDAIDWLNAHYFDYRGLIEKGLALEVPEGMYNLEKK